LFKHYLKKKLSLGLGWGLDHNRRDGEDGIVKSFSEPDNYPARLRGFPPHPRRTESRWVENDNWAETMVKSKFDRV
jgi:hypothetical protein